MDTDLQIRERPAGPRAGRSLRDSLLGLGGELAGVAVRPLAAGVTLGLRAERELRGALASRGEAAALAALDTLLASELAAEAIDRVLASEVVRKAVDAALTGPLLNEAVERLLQTDELWLLVDEIAHSPSVAEAITQQSVGFMDEVADSVRTRTRSADDRLESRVRRVFGRKPRAQPDEGGSGA